MKKYIGLVACVALALTLAGAGCAKKEAAPAGQPEVTAPAAGQQAAVPAGEEKTPVEKYFDKTAVVAPQAEKAKAVDAIMQPILKKIFDTVDKDGNPVNQVKLKEEFGPMFTYVFNRPVTDGDISEAQVQLTAAGFKILESSGKQMTVTKIGSTWVITFWLNNMEKSGMEMTF